MENDCNQKAGPLWIQTFRNVDLEQPFSAGGLSEVPKTSPLLRDSLEYSAWSVPQGRISHSKTARIDCWVLREQGTGGVGRNPCAGFLVLSSSRGVPTSHSSQQESAATCLQCCCPRKLTKAEVFIWDWSHRHPLSSMYPHSGLPGGERVFSTNHSVQMGWAQGATFII